MFLDKVPGFASNFYITSSSKGIKHIFVTTFKQKILAGFVVIGDRGQSKDGIVISQRMYATGILEETSLMNGLSCET